MAGAQIPPQGPHGGYGPTPPTYVFPGSGFAVGPAEHELGELENQTLRRTASAARGLAIALFVAAGLSVFGCYFTNILAFVAVGIPTLLAANALQRVVDTRGRDITNVLEAVQALGTSFLVRIIAVAVIVALTAAMLALMVAFFGVIAALVAGGELPS